MLIARKNGRKIRAMVMNVPVDQCLGVVQCALPGCEAYLPLVVDTDSAKEQVAWFLDHHECRAPAGKKSAGRKPS
jgi:hypothetical protein